MILLCDISDREVSALSSRSSKKNPPQTLVVLVADDSAEGGEMIKLMKTGWRWRGGGVRITAAAERENHT